MPGNVPQPTPIIHMTHIGNLDEILAKGALSSTARLQAADARYNNIAYSSIQAQRAARQVPCGPGGCLHDYVPFYFTTRSPMLYTIHRGNVPCEGGQGALVHLVSTAQKVAEAGLGFAFTDGHGIMTYSSFFDDLGRLGEVDWDVVGSRQWADTLEDGDRKRRKQAEFLVRDAFPVTLLSGLAVQSAARKAEGEALLERRGVRMKVVEKSAWYY